MSQVVRLLLLVVVLVAEPVLAASGDAIFQGPLQQIIDTLTGPTGRLVAAVVIAGLGIGAFFGRFSWIVAGRIVGGIILIFGCVTIADLFIDTVA